MRDFTSEGSRLLASNLLDLSRRIDLYGSMLTASEKHKICRVLDRITVKVSGLTVPCTWCGQPMTRASQARYCSDACRQECYRDRKARK